MTRGQEEMEMQIAQAQSFWDSVKASRLVRVDSNTEACMDKIMELWTWDNVQAHLTSDDWKWSVTHGDFHAGQMMINNDSDMWDDIILLDWEWAGFSNPAIDLATWFCFHEVTHLMENEDNYLQIYWSALQD